MERTKVTDSIVHNKYTAVLSQLFIANLPENVRKVRTDLMA